MWDDRGDLPNDTTLGVLPAEWNDMLIKRECQPNTGNRRRRAFSLINEGYQMEGVWTQGTADLSPREARGAPGNAMQSGEGRCMQNVLSGSRKAMAQ